MSSLCGTFGEQLQAAAEARLASKLTAAAKNVYRQSLRRLLEGPHDPVTVGIDKGVSRGAAMIAGYTVEEILFDVTALTELQKAVEDYNAIHRQILDLSDTINLASRTGTDPGIVRAFKRQLDDLHRRRDAVSARGRAIRGIIPRVY